MTLKFAKEKVIIIDYSSLPKAIKEFFRTKVVKGTYLSYISELCPDNLNFEALKELYKII